MWKLKRPFWYYIFRIGISLLLVLIVGSLIRVFQYDIGQGLYNFAFGIPGVTGIMVLISFCVYLFGVGISSINKTAPQLIVLGIIFYFLVLYLLFIALYGAFDFWNTFRFKQDFINRGFNLNNYGLYIILFVLWSYYLFLLAKNECTKKDVAS